MTQQPSQVQPGSFDNKEESHNVLETKNDKEELHQIKFHYHALQLDELTKQQQLSELPQSSSLLL
jgi:hypothetical protein